MKGIPSKNTFQGSLYKLTSQKRLKKGQGFRKRGEIGTMERMKRERIPCGMKRINQVGQLLFCYIKIENFLFER